MRVDALTGDAFAAALPEVARLRIEVFRAFPYLYDGDLAYEERYLHAFAASPRAILVGAFDGDALVGASTGAPLADHADDFAAAFAGTDLDLAEVFYCAESVLQPAYRGRGIGHRFFDLREAHARAHGFKKVCFCAVMRAPDHPARPADYRPLDGFWQARGYAPRPGVVATFSWKEHGQTTETTNHLQFWMRDL